MCELTFVARQGDGLILVETWDDVTSSRPFQTLKNQAKQILKRLNSAPANCSIDSENYTFHYITENGVCYMTLCEKAYPKKLAFAFLGEVHRAFEEELKREFGTHSVDYRSLIETIEKPYYFIKFDRIIQRKKADYRDPRSNRALSKLNESLSEVTDIMRKNIDEILLRGDKLEDVSRKADDLKLHSSQFASSARTLRIQAMLQKYAPCAVFGVIMLCLIYYLYWSRS